MGEIINYKLSFQQNCKQGFIRNLIKSKQNSIPSNFIHLIIMFSWFIFFENPNYNNSNTLLKFLIAILITMLIVFLLIVGWAFYQYMHVQMLQVWTNGPKCMPSWQQYAYISQRIMRHIEKNGALYTMTTYDIENKVINFKLNNF